MRNIRSVCLPLPFQWRPPFRPAIEQTDLSCTLCVMWARQFSNTYSSNGWMGFIGTANYYSRYCILEYEPVGLRHVARNNRYKSDKIKYVIQSKVIIHNECDEYHRHVLWLDDCAMYAIRGHLRFADCDTHRIILFSFIFRHLSSIAIQHSPRTLISILHCDLNFWTTCGFIDCVEVQKWFWVSVVNVNANSNAINSYHRKLSLSFFCRIFDVDITQNATKW